MSKVGNSSIVIQQAPCGQSFGHTALQSQLETLVRKGYRIVSVMPEGESYIIIAQALPRKPPVPGRP